MTVAWELAKYKLDLVGVQEIRWEKEGTVRAREYTFFYGKGQEKYQLGTGFFVHQRRVSAIKRVGFVSDRMSYIVLRGRRCNIIVLNVHAPTEEKGDDSKDSFYEDFPKHHMKILLGNFNAKGRRKDTFKLAIGNVSLHQESNDKGVNE
jgi:exonuclease III